MKTSSQAKRGALPLLRGEGVGERVPGILAATTGHYIIGTDE
jgi:hypothetical protein